MREENMSFRGRRLRLLVRGIVQGVGFRPFVFNLARKLNLRGYVKNTGTGVVIDIEGELVDHFVDSLTRHPPPLASITSVEITPVTESGTEYSGFVILESEDGTGFTLTSPDVSICDDCLGEMMDPADRRYLYPFINCTNCGPRYTITEDVPYDRPNTTMRAFRMCRECEREYNDPSDRRFHAQPNACPRCGPSLEFECGDTSPPDGPDPVARTIAALARGMIVAIKGLGGFHIACDALNDEAVTRLRRQKRRNNKPFALMAPDIRTIEKYCLVSERESALLASPARPIVLLRKRPGASPVARDVAPGMEYLGFMLPYTPLHYLLFRHPGAVSPECLVMTSGNLSEEPIVTAGDEARRVLSGIADAFLFHDRDIFMRVDDSVFFVLQGGGGRRPLDIPVRRARGYVPEAIPVGAEGPDVLAVGADLKNTFTVTKGRYAIPSQHIGDMENIETLDFFEETLENLRKVYRVEPVAVGHDMHPDYFSTRWAMEQKDMRTVPVQHHHAHCASVMAEHCLDGDVIGVVMDGTGYGTDGNMWGGEFLVCNTVSFRRAGHFRYMPLAGGESAIRHPWKTAVSFIREAVGSDAPEYIARTGIVERCGEKEVSAVLSLCDRREFTVLSSGAGRLFDAISSIAGICDENTFEGEAPMKLESAIRYGIEDDYPVDIVMKDPLEVDFSYTLISVIHDLERGVDRAEISARFHNTITAIIVRVVQRLRDMHSLSRVVLSGGTFQNRYLLGRTMLLLERAGVEVFVNTRVPPNDAGVSLGQAYIVRERLKRGI